MVRVLLAAALAVLMAAPAAAAVPGFAPRAHRDAAEPRKGALDLRSAAFGQVGTQLSLTVRTGRAWTARGSFCVTLLGDRPVGRVCVSRARRPLVRFDPAGSDRPRTVRGAAVERSGRTLRVLLYPRALGLRPGDFRWVLRSGRDRLPDAGFLPLSVSVYGAPRCFGAAARDGSGCENPALERLVTPHPRDAELLPDLPCERTRDSRRYGTLVPCSFGARYAAGPPRLALIGDSHAMSFRATADVAAHALRLKAIALNEAGCGFATEVHEGWPPVGENCRRYTDQVLRWLRTHPSVDTVILTASATHGYTEAGLREIWSRIPESVRRIHVVADVPRVNFKTADCVRSVSRRNAVSTGACGLPRDKETLPPDPVREASAGGDPRVHLIDLTPHFCDSTHCFPVIGGAYVYRDTNHMNLVFAPTLGPYLLEQMSLAP